MYRGKKINKPIVLAIAVMLMMVAAPSIVAVQESDSPSYPLTLEGAKPKEMSIRPLGPVTAGNTGETLISVNSPEEDHLPALTRDGDGNTVVVWSHHVSALESDIGMSYSTDDGSSWNPSIFEFEGYQYYADIAYFEGTRYEGPQWDGLWLESLDADTEAGTFILITDITDPGSYEAYGWTEGSRPGATCLNFENDMWYRMFYYEYAPGPVVAMINDDQGMNQGLELWWMSAGEDLGSVVYNWDSGTGPEGPYMPARDIHTAAVHDSDPAWTEEDFFYVVCQSDIAEASQVLYKRCVPIEESDIEYAEESYFLDGGDLYDAAHPCVAASGDRVIVVYMSTDNIYGDWDIVCQYSTDRGQNWETSVIAEDHPADETYPDVYMSGSTVFVAYAKNGNLYVTKSEDGGATWGEPDQVNGQDGTVVEEENAIDIAQGGIVWTDNRNGDKDIYYAPLPSAIINVGTISGGFGVSATVTNTGTEDASAIDWTISLSGPVFVGKEASGTIDSLPAGGETTIGTGLVFGIGPTTITVTAGGATKTASGFVLGPLVLGL